MDGITTPLRYTIGDACTALRIGRSRLYDLIRAGAIRTHRDGSRTFIAAAELHRYVASCADGTGQPERGPALAAARRQAAA